MVSPGIVHPNLNLKILSKFNIMKQLITIIFALLFSAVAFAQGIGINYTAVIKDEIGNTVASQLINVKFAILSIDDTIVYEEEHLDEMTDANGIINLVIGDGDAIVGNFFDIIWGDDLYKLQVAIDIEDDGSYEIFPASSFKSVPYAYHADRASVAENITGLVALDEGNGIGWRLESADPTMYSPIGENAVDLSINSSAFSLPGAAGDYAVAMGNSTYAEGTASTAVGNSTRALGDNSTALGNLSTASGINSTAMGYASNASGENSTAMGYGTDAIGDSSTAMGFFTTALAMYSSAMGNQTIASTEASTVLGKYNESDLDGLFIIGNGTDAGAANRNNALVVRTNGDAQFDGEIQRTSTGGANMVPIAYGSVDATGAIIGGTGNFSVTYNSSDTTYTIFVDNTPITAANSTGIVSVNTSTFRTANTTYDGINMLVHIFLNNGNKVQSPFQFVIYKK